MRSKLTTSRRNGGDTAAIATFKNHKISTVSTYGAHGIRRNFLYSAPTVHKHRRERTRKDARPVDPLPATDDPLFCCLLSSASSSVSFPTFSRCPLSRAAGPAIRRLRVSSCRWIRAALLHQPLSDMIVVK